MRRFSDHTTEELLSVILGDRLGAGVDRETYVCAFDHKWVVKVCVGEWDYQNVAEHMLWHAARPDLRRWLAPVHRITRDGKVLIMARCEPCPSHLLPDKVPEVIAADMHRENVGLYEGRVVCMDYGRHAAAKIAANAKRLIVAPRLETESDRRTW